MPEVAVEKRFITTPKCHNLRKLDGRYIVVGGSSYSDTCMTVDVTFGIVMAWEFQLDKYM